MKARLRPLERSTCPFAEVPEQNAPTTWVEPKVVAEVSFHSWTDDDHLRAPVFLRLRDDVDPKAVRRAKPGGVAPPPPHPPPATRSTRSSRSSKRPKAAMTLAVGPHRIRLTHLDRVYWPANPALKQPALTKRDLLRYCAQVSPYMLPHLADRPLTMIRMPDGIRGQRFFQKHWEQERPGFVESITVFSGHKDERHEYLLCNNLPTLLWLAQSGTLEFHVWHSRAKWEPDARSKSTDYASSLASLEASVLNYPDYVLFDIDPYIYSGKEAAGAEPELNTVAFEKGKEVAFWLRELLQSMSLDAIVKTSGKTGPPRLRSDPAHDRLRCGAPRLRARGTAPDAGASEGHHPRLERAQADRQDLHGLQHERPRQDAQCRVFAARRAGWTCFDASDLGRACQRPPARLHDHQRRATVGANGRPLGRRPQPQAEPREGPGTYQGLSPRANSARRGARFRVSENRPSCVATTKAADRRTAGQRPHWRTRHNGLQYQSLTAKS